MDLWLVFEEWLESPTLNDKSGGLNSSGWSMLVWAWGFSLSAHCKEPNVGEYLYFYTFELSNEPKTPIPNRGV